jgi:hypothetical protein
VSAALVGGVLCGTMDDDDSDGLLQRDDDMAWSSAATAWRMGEIRGEG